ncbi:unnamed protein product [Sphagnum jensenii]|uniref:Uncharacterized protein n=1 Tax=Sphagnum jensenii TaxID=128206 RepID=A0ABP1BYG9_9BRYO
MPELRVERTCQHNVGLMQRLIPSWQEASRDHLNDYTRQMFDVRDEAPEAPGLPFPPRRPSPTTFESLVLTRVALIA